jgi:hypothetical protein
MCQVKGFVKLNGLYNITVLVPSADPYLFKLSITSGAAKTV